MATQDNPMQPAPTLVALLGEMQALMGILPAVPAGQPHPDPFAGLTAAEAACCEDDAMEAGFDNMPV